MENFTLSQRLRSAEGQTLIQEVLAADPKASRGRLARELCARLKWLNARGRPKEVGCRKVLLRLEREGRIVLPVARKGRPTRRPPEAGLEIGPQVTGTLADLGAVTLEPVKGRSAESSRWHALLAAHHPLGGGPLCGEQIRYLIMSEKHGVLGGLAVSASAWRLKARDEWLGWDDAQRLKNLQGVVNNTRFLILPTVQVKNLASHVLGLLAQRIRRDWQERYNHAPWLMETFIDASRPATCYRAANWIEVGVTTGRGRQDRAHAREAPKKPPSEEEKACKNPEEEKACKSQEEEKACHKKKKKACKTKTAEARKAKREAAKEKAAQARANQRESAPTAGPEQAAAPKRKSKTPKADRKAGPRKRVFLYPLCRETLKTLCPRHGLRDLAASRHEGWLRQEFGGARLGDRRLEDRLLQIGEDFFANPEAGIPEACGGSKAKIKGAYRFLTHESVTMEAIIEPHRRATIERLRDEPVVLVVEDSSSLNLTTLEATEDLGPIGTKVDGAQGMILHSATAFRPDGLSLGVLHAHCIRRDPAEHGKKKQRASKKIEAKESYKWIEALAPVEEAASRCPNTRIVVTADREADIYEFFLEANKRKLDLLVRAKEDRLVTDVEASRLIRKPTVGAPPKNLWRQMGQVLEAGQFELALPRRGARPKRTAKISVRHARVSFLPPQDKPRLPLFEAWVVWADEISIPPEGVKPLEWMLITTVPVHSFDDALERVRWYACRWNIEVFHRTIKSGCRFQDRRLGLADRLEACLAIDMVVAWRIQHITWLSRAEPDAPCTIAYEDDEWKAVMAITTGRPAPDAPPTLKEMTHAVAGLGGFISGKSRGHPGTQTLWRGLLHMDDITTAFRLFRSLYLSPAPPSDQQPTAPPDYDPPFRSSG